MPYPTILIDSATGSDTAASGAGPGTALTGSAATSDVTGTVITLDGLPDLSGVATDGSHAIYLHETTAGRRCWASITAVDNGADTVTVAEAVRASIPGGDNIAWAIGGKRASLGGSQSKKLVDNNSTSGDAMSGWIIEFQSGHTETIAGTMDLRRATDNTNGPLTIQGKDAAATRPVITFSNNGNGFVPRGAGWRLKSFDLANSNATKTASVAIAHLATAILIDLHIDIAGSRFWKGILNNVIRYCHVSTENTGIEFSASAGSVEFSDVYDCGNHGIAITGSQIWPTRIVGNVIRGATNDGINDANSGTASGGNGGAYIAHNDFYDNGRDGYRNTNTATGRGLPFLYLLNNYFHSNGGYGINFTGASMSGAILRSLGSFIAGNGYYTNTSGTINLSDIEEDAQNAIGPDNASYGTSGNFYKGASFGGKALGIPLLNIASTRSYVDIGVAQRQEPAGSGGGGPLVGGRLAL